MVIIFFLMWFFFLSFQDPAGIFELVELVGNGTYGQVYKVRTDTSCLYWPRPCVDKKILTLWLVGKHRGSKIKETPGSRDVQMTRCSFSNIVFSFSNLTLSKFWYVVQFLHLNKFKLASKLLFLLYAYHFSLAIFVSFYPDL